MIKIHEDVLKALKKGKIPKNVFKLFYDAFVSIDMTKNMKLFDIKQIHTEKDIIFYRLRKNKYRAIFYIENDDYIIVKIAKREEVYRLWV